MNIELVTMIIFFSIVGILLYLKRKKIDFHSGLVIIRWKRGLQLIDKITKNHEKAFKIAGYFVIGIGFLGGLVGLWGIAVTIINMNPGGLGLVLPTAGGYEYPGPIIGVPFWYWLVAIFIIMFSHETMHAIFARAAGVPLKNYGVILLLVLPFGAFVDPDNKKVKKMKTSRKLSFFAAGSFANFLVATFLIALILVFNGFFIKENVVIYNTSEGYPAHDANLTGILKSVNGVDVNTGDDFSRILNNTAPGTNIQIITDTGSYNITTVKRPDDQTGSYIGVYSFTTRSVTNNVLGRLFAWLIILNIGIGIANLLPWKPFDGGLMAEEVLTRISKRNGKLLSNILTWIMLAAVLFALFGIRIIGAIS